MPKLVKVKNFYTRAEAEMAKGILESSGISAVLQMAGASVVIHSVDRSGETDLLVPDPDLDRARELLDVYLENSR